MAEKNAILSKLDGLVERFNEVATLITETEVIADQKRFVRLSKEYKELENILQARIAYIQTLQGIEESKKFIFNEIDPELKEIAQEELAACQERLPKIEEEIKLLLTPADPQDGKNAIVEIRSGTGGDEAAIFAGDLFKMYSKFCESKGWKIQVSNLSEGTIGGYKEIIFSVTGESVYGIMKYESGVHRVQRIPQTEAQGRIHTSAATVAVLPEADELDVEVQEKDIRRDEFCSSGAGGQSVNTTYSAIRLTHIPSGIVVQCQDERSKLQNYERALAELRTRLYNIAYQKYLDDIASKRKTMVSTGDRSAKIRTYNYPQGRITDHRINYTIYNLTAFMDGDIQDCINHLTVAENAERLKENEI